MRRLKNDRHRAAGQAAPTKRATPLPLSKWSKASCKAVRVVFADIDDTLTLDGKLIAESYAAMCTLAKAGVDIVPVTGRPAGWCDHIARMWPVRGVVGENGAFYFYHDPKRGRLIQRFLLDDAERNTMQRRLSRVQKQIQKAVPRAGIASDQGYRIHDLAIDFCEDVPRLSPAEIQKIVDTFERAGATAKVSSIHVNGWFGRWDKVTMIRRFAKEVLGFDIMKPSHQERVVYVGDSPNDEPAFAFFRQSIGVQNIAQFLDVLSAPPTYITKKLGGLGFAEVAKKILAAKPR